MKKTFGFCLVLCGVLVLAGVCPAAEVKIALDSPPDLEKSGTYVWAKSFWGPPEGERHGREGVPAGRAGRGGGEAGSGDPGSPGGEHVRPGQGGQLEPSIFGFNLPYMFDSIEHMDRTIQKTELFKKVNDGATKKGVRVLSLVVVGGFSGLANTKKPVNTPEDLKGLRIRAMDKSQAQYIEAWGAGTVIVPWAEIYNALQTGIADGYLNAAVVPLLFKHTEVLKHYSDIRYSAPLRLAICSEEWYRKLPADQRKIVDDAAAKATAANRAWQIQIDKTGLEELEKAGTKVTRNTPEQRAQFAKLSRTVYEKIVGREVAEAFVKASDANR